MNYTIDNIPLKTFCILVDDPSKIDNYEVSGEQWSEITNKYAELNPTPEHKLLLEAFRSVVKESINITKYVSLLKIIKGVTGDWKPYFEKIKLPYSGDTTKDLARIGKEISKSQQKEKIYDSKLKQIEKQLAESQKNKLKEDFNIQKINQAIASLEIAGATIPDYDTLTLSKYEALGEIYKQNERRNTKR